MCHRQNKIFAGIGNAVGNVPWKSEPTDLQPSTLSLGHQERGQLRVIFQNCHPDVLNFVHWKVIEQLIALLRPGEALRKF